jgi:hypothetical protein
MLAGYLLMRKIDPEEEKQLEEDMLKIPALLEEARKARDSKVEEVKQEPQQLNMFDI